MLPQDPRHAQGAQLSQTLCDQYCSVRAHDYPQSDQILQIKAFTRRNLLVAGLHGAAGPKKTAVLGRKAGKRARNHASCAAQVDPSGGLLEGRGVSEGYSQKRFLVLVGVQRAEESSDRSVEAGSQSARAED